MGVKDTAILSVLGLATDELEKLSKEEIYRNLSRTKELGDVLKNYEKELRDIAFSAAELVGDKDDKGSYFVRLPDGTWFKKEARTSVKVKTEEAITLFKEKGLDNRLSYDISALDPNDIVEYLPPHLMADTSFTIKDEDVEQAFYAGEITDTELQELVERNVTYALKIGKKK